MIIGHKTEESTGSSEKQSVASKGTKIRVDSQHVTAMPMALQVSDCGMNHGGWLNIDSNESKIYIVELYKERKRTSPRVNHHEIQRVERRHQ